MKEDQLTKKLIEKATNTDEDDRNSDFETEIVPEKHYNYYGTRGIADLYIRTIQKYGAETYQDDTVIEVKTHLENANEVVRQFNKMKRFFYKDPANQKPSERITFKLVILANESNLKHVLENEAIYKEAINRNDKVSSIILFKHPENIEAAPICLDILFGDYKVSFEEYCKQQEMWKFFNPSKFKNSNRVKA